ncbi:hypothetical protein [Nitrosopumilus sp.]|uniref:hypothetical protein n=1 Tax=Nitrosopumilus sp. TaxID=2024843 RepID=UPI002606FA5E|nr:hypothetical protein [Nitrosopumilus sp.]
MALVIAMFVIVGVYVGYHASQQVEDQGEAHSINFELELLEQNTENMQILHNQEIRKTMI